ncbi:hypothetical protein CR970_00270 [Candidatus Saccharibacteria bacterium]|nr:MAG: hypothetical protein CR970_00270 [Candidatus Saccharibacteria bacterium]
MDLNKVISKIDELEHHVQRLQRMEDLLEKLVDSNHRQAQYLEKMWDMYDQARRQQEYQDQQ